MKTTILYNGILLVLVALVVLSWTLTIVSAQDYLVSSTPIKKCTPTECKSSTRLSFEFPVTKGAFYKFRARNLELGERDIIINLTSPAIHCQLPCKSGILATTLALTPFGSCLDNTPCPANTCGTDPYCKTWDVKYNFGCWPLTESFMCFKAVYTTSSTYAIHTVKDDQCHLTGQINISSASDHYLFPIHEGSQTKGQFHLGINAIGHHNIFENDAVIIQEGSNWFLSKQDDFCQFNVNFDCFGRVYYPSACGWEATSVSVVHPKEIVQISDVHPILSSANFRVSTRTISHFNHASKNLNNIFPGYVYTPESTNLTTHTRPMLSIFEHGEDSIRFTVDLTDEFVGEIADDLSVTFTMTECRQYDNDELHCNFEFVCKGSGKFRIYHEDNSKLLSCSNNKFDQTIAFQTQVSEAIEVCVDTDTNQRICKSHSVEHIRDIIENTTITDTPAFGDHILNHPHFYTISGIVSLSVSGVLLLYLILGLAFKICFPMNLIKVQLKQSLARDEIESRKKEYERLHPEENYRKPIMTNDRSYIYENTSGNMYPDVNSRYNSPKVNPVDVPKFSGFDV